MRAGISFISKHNQQQFVNSCSDLLQPVPPKLLNPRAHREHNQASSNQKVAFMFSVLSGNHPYHSFSPWRLFVIKSCWVVLSAELHGSWLGRVVPEREVKSVLFYCQVSNIFIDTHRHLNDMLFFFFFFPSTERAIPGSESGSWLLRIGIAYGQRTWQRFNLRPMMMTMLGARVPRSVDHFILGNTKSN